MTSNPERFYSNLVNLLDNVIGMLERTLDICGNDYGLDEMKKIKSLLTMAKKGALLDTFIAKYDMWNLIVTKNKDEIIKVLPTLFGDILDASPLTAPIKVYDKLVAENYSREDPSTSYSDDDYQGSDKHWPVTSNDVKIIWDFLLNLVKIACKHIVNTLKTNPRFTNIGAKHVAFYKTCDVSYFEKVLNFNASS